MPVPHFETGFHLKIQWVLSGKGSEAFPAQLPLATCCPRCLIIQALDFPMWLLLVSCFARSCHNVVNLPTQGSIPQHSGGAGSQALG